MVMRKSSNGSGETIYSHSRLWLYESCPEFYKLKYIDKKAPQMPTTIPLFLGSAVHEALEWLYYQVKHREVSIDELMEYFTERWISLLQDESLRAEDGDDIQAYNKGVRFLTDYYTKNKPFKQNVLAIERKVLFSLDPEGKYKIQGFIDRLDMAEDGTYEVHDYKTNQSMKKKEDFENDRQLALYHIGLKEAFGKEIKVKLIWHFLNFNKQVVSERTPEQLDKLRYDTIELIKKIESTTEWPSCNGRYCDWCNYKKDNNTNYDELIKSYEEIQKKAVLFLPDDVQFTETAK
ncbi:MAG: PD-(D/E)XK nuclease family protein [Nanoarchaeota archaeon]